MPIAMEAKPVTLLVGETFLNKLKDTEITKATQFKDCEIKTIVDVPSIFPILACIVHDALDEEINVMVLYEY